MLLVLIGIVSLQFGAGLAKTFFEEASPTTLVWMRLLCGSVVLLALARPRLRGHSGTDWLVVVGFGTCLALMNWAIYHSFARLPLGIAVTIEFLGPLSVALFGSRRRRDLLWVVLAGLGVLLLGFERTSLDPLGVAFALLAATAWAAYILLSAQTGRRWEGVDGLALASTVGALLILPLVLGRYAEELASPQVWLIGAVVGLLASVVPYSCELVALRQMRPPVFGILMSLEPAAAALVGVVVLGELLGPLQWLALACVMTASIGATRSGGRPQQLTG